MQLGPAPGSGGGSGSDATPKRKRKSRWQNNEDDKTYIPGMPTVIPSGLNKEQEEQYLREF